MRENTTLWTFPARCACHLIHYLLLLATITVITDVNYVTLNLLLVVVVVATIHHNSDVTSHVAVHNNLVDVIQ